MRIITERKLREFWRKHKDAEAPLRAFISQARAADWQSFADVREIFSSADYHNGLVIFDIGGNKYRLIASIRYRKHLVFVRAVLTHKEYDIHKNWCDCGQLAKKR